MTSSPSICDHGFAGITQEKREVEDKDDIGAKKKKTEWYKFGIALIIK